MQMFHYIWIILIFSNQFFCVLTIENEEENDIEKKVRKPFKFLDILGDIEHIKSDLLKSLKIKNIEQITTNDAVFYFHKMHDYDGNNKLDGIELFQSFRHFSPDKSFVKSENELAEMVDSFLLFDEDNDGLLTYAEYKKKYTSSRNEN